MKTLIQTDRRLQLLLIGGLIVQLLTCITQSGVYDADQYFQIIEFSTWQLHRPSGATHVWELAAMIRPTLQVYLFSGYTLLCQFFKIYDPYLQLTILRIILGLAMFALFNAMAIYYFKNEKRNVLYFVLLLLNFSWLLPFTRTLYSSEMMSSLFFFGTLFLYHTKKNAGTPFLLLIGFLFSLSFYFRFQTAFALMSAGIWILLEKRFKDLLPLAAGFLAGVLLNAWLDHGFYHQWVFTPYAYYHVNITEGKAASMGTSSFIRYIGMLIATILTPPFSIVLFYYALKGSLKKYRHPLFMAVICFIVGHSLVAHKEERFMFPILNVLPIFVGWGLPELFRWYATCKRWIAGILKVLFAFSLALNLFLLFAFMILIPYSQTIHFTSVLKHVFSNDPVTIYAIRQTPFETENGLALMYYRTAFPNMEVKKLDLNDPVHNIPPGATYIAVTYNHIRPADRLLLEKQGYRPVRYSSSILWNLNEFLHSKNMNTINDIWVLYKKD